LKFILNRKAGAEAVRLPSRAPHPKIEQKLGSSSALCLRLVARWVVERGRAWR
jgi:hypothetical protein